MITLGVDIGSLTGKAVVMKDGAILSQAVILTGPDSVETGQQVTQQALDGAGLTLQDMDFTVSTGYGRIVIPFADKNVSEISCHARGASHLFPKARTILDMGGQDCKAIRCDEAGKVTDFAMNDKCAAGAGRSMGIVSELVKVPLPELGPLSLRAEQRDGDGVPVSSTCVVFARSEIVGYLRNGVPKSEILAGSCAALCARVQALLRRVGLEDDFVISGGIARNPGVVTRLEQRLCRTAHIAAEPQIVGALGAALFARDLLEKRAAGAARREKRAAGAARREKRGPRARRSRRPRRSPRDRGNEG
jgi:benzoyl-CoA reductase subunit A